MKKILNMIIKRKINSFILLLFILISLLVINRPEIIIQFKVVNNSLENLGFKIKKIDISGNNVLKNAQILDNLVYLDCNNLFCIDLVSSKSRIEKNGWVKSAKLKYILPSKLKITISEEKPYFLLKKNNQFTLLNINGKEIEVLDSFESNYNNLIVLSGNGAENKVEHLIKILKVSNEITSKITSANLISNRRWSLIYNSTVTIELPEENAIQALYKISQLEEKYNLLSSKLKKIDLRISDRMIIELNTKTSYAKENNI